MSCLQSWNKLLEAALAVIELPEEHAKENAQNEDDPLAGCPSNEWNSLITSKGNCNRDNDVSMALSKSCHKQDRMNKNTWKLVQHILLILRCTVGFVNVRCNRSYTSFCVNLILNSLLSFTLCVDRHRRMCFST